MSTVECLGDPSAVLVTLFRVALQRLRHGAMLVFWLPTKAFTTAEEVRIHIGRIHAAAVLRNAVSNGQAILAAGRNEQEVASASAAVVATNIGRRLHTNTDTIGLHIVRVTAEELNDNMWRWLCVMQRS